MRVEREPAFVLHARDWRETSLLLEIFSRHHGRLGLIAKGAKRPRSRVRALLQPFQPLRLNWGGRGELALLAAAEPERRPIVLRAEALFCGFYINELLVRLLHRHDAHERLYDHYGAALRALAAGAPTEATLRIFEKRLLKEIGYALVLDREVDSGGPIEPGRRYHYVPERGPTLRANTAAGVPITGKSLMALAAERLTDPGVLREIKELMRAVLAVYLDGRPLHSRRLFQQVRAGAHEAKERAGRA